MAGTIIPFRSRGRAGGRLVGRIPTDGRAQLWFWSRTMDRLTDYLVALKSRETEMPDPKIIAPEGEPVVIMTRTLNAPRALVWKALSEPEHVVRWWGPHGHRNRALEFDFRVGGRWRIETTTGEGHVIVFFGEYRVIEKPVKITQTFSFDQLPEGAHSVDTVVLEDHGDRTVYRATSTLPDLASRDGMLASGMETGVVEGFERLDAMLEAFKAGA
ncbi:MAG: SRPBCC domain-containing protein [Devosia sp.]|nr:SRPBCC domain-containing protein [Devosia sp.]